MRPTFILLFLALAHFALCYGNKCHEKDEACNSTDYQSYVNCIRRRQKRSLDCQGGCDNGNCIDMCNSCSCDSCNYNNCQSTCNSCCNTCCSNYIPCRTNHCCHKTCHAQCNTTDCRSSCRKKCFEIIKQPQNETVLMTNSSGAHVSSNNEIRHNVTTIIHLNNVINNTNVVDIPIMINNTNEQNITLYSNDNATSLNSTAEKCCTVIGPRQCVTTPTPRCFHYRSKQCGPYCTATIVHKEQQQVCESIYPGAPPQCRQQVMYIPQPQPRCVYQSEWPYVACGIQRPATCDGCYGHYVNQESTSYASCSPQCYDEGFGLGPLYRQGPIYRPSYSHAPCYSCFGYADPYQGSGGFPGYGFGGVMPYFNPQVQPPYYPYYDNQQLSDNEIPVPLEAPVATTNFSGGVPMFEPLFRAGEFGPQTFFPNDPYRNSRDVEIEVNVEPGTSDAQAQVKIKNDRVVKEQDVSTETSAKAS